jgi:hypothetical protein
MSNYIRLEMLVRDKHSSLLDQFVSYEEKEVPGANHALYSGLFKSYS